MVFKKDDTVQVADNKKEDEDSVNYAANDLNLNKNENFSSLSKLDNDENSDDDSSSLHNETAPYGVPLHPPFFPPFMNKNGMPPHPFHHHHHHPGAFPHPPPPFMPSPNVTTNLGQKFDHDEDIETEEEKNHHHSFGPHRGGGRHHHHGPHHHPFNPFGPHHHPFNPFGPHHNHPFGPHHNHPFGPHGGHHNNSFGPHAAEHHDHHHHGKHHGGKGHCKRPGRLMARFVEHVTIPEDHFVLPNDNLVKTWLVRNDSHVTWPKKCELVFIGGDRNMLPKEESLLIDGGLEPGKDTKVSIRLQAPNVCGRYECCFRFQEINIRDDGIVQVGQKFGQRLWCSIQVVDQLPFSTSEGESSSDIENELDDKKLKAKRERLERKSEKLQRKMKQVEAKLNNIREKLEKLNGSKKS